MFTGEMTYLHHGHASYPLRIGHEWCGVVASVGPGVDAAWLGRRVTGDTMLGCGHCHLCRSGRQHVCVLALDRRLPLPVATVIGTTTPGSLSSAARILRN